MAETPRKLLDRRRLGSDAGVGSPAMSREASTVERLSDLLVPSMSLEGLSFPPSQAELDSYVDVPIAALPKQYKRDNMTRVFVNRDLDLGRMEFFGFDMDYTLAVYKSPEYEAMTYDLLTRRLVDIGYPASILELRYDPTFPLRGLCVDNKLGNLLKLDEFGAILQVVHGRTPLDTAQIEDAYPNRYISPSDLGHGRYAVYDTLFAMPEACLYADLVRHFESSMGHTEDGIVAENFAISFEALHTDVRAAVDHVHAAGALKKATVAELDRFVEPQPRLAELLNRLRAQAKVFLLTNSDFAYTNTLMDWLLRASYTAAQPNWRAFFDIVIVSARKPAFFSAGTALREVDVESGAVKLQRIRALEPGRVYQGGSLEEFAKLTGARGSRVLYVGDHIFGDVVKSKRQGWRTLLVIRELEDERESWTRQLGSYTHLVNLQFILAEVYRGLDASATVPPDVKPVQEALRKCLKQMHDETGTTFGSAFRTGSRKSFFSQQVEQFADLYSASFANLLSYPLFYLFRAADQIMPHEITAYERSSAPESARVDGGAGASASP
eukprot:a3370_123.p1 GENE.a3370_123~~a3370_123.p1  ORF type:complete len:563 (+),score=265.98 a3370_123:32-1690(+)